ncbi:MAG TPA: FAD:protein FMN transferase [Lysobacter sp.]|nr:FAD:protein FMN transferase [Lysobacter sp.]
MQRARPLLGTLVVIRIDADDNADVAFDAAFAQIEAVHRAMSFHEAESQLSRLNRHAAHAPQTVGPLLWRVLCTSLALARASGGRFDPTVAGRLVQWQQLPTPADAPAPDPDATWRDVELLPGRRVQFRKRLWLDFGGIAKGYAVDRAVAALRARGVRAGVVNAGGDLRVFGDTQETVHVRDPGDPASSRPLLQLREGAVATSSGYFSARGGHTALVDMRSDASLGDGISVSVCAPRAIWADALTKIVLADADAAVSLLRRLHAQAAILDASGAMRTLS